VHITVRFLLALIYGLSSFLVFCILFSRKRYLAVHPFVAGLKANAFADPLFSRRCFISLFSLFFVIPVCMYRVKFVRTDPVFRTLPVIGCSFSRQAVLATSNVSSGITTHEAVWPFLVRSFVSNPAHEVSSVSSEHRLSLSGFPHITFCVLFFQFSLCVSVLFVRSGLLGRVCATRVALYMPRLKPLRRHTLVLLSPTLLFCPNGFTLQVLLLLSAFPTLTVRCLFLLFLRER